MSKVIVDESLRRKLNGLTGDTEFCSPEGQPLGYFVTVSDYMDLLYARAQKRFSPEQIERLRQQQGGRPLNEIMRDLEAR
jgi:hypothetical protein